MGHGATATVRGEGDGGSHEQEPLGLPRPLLILFAVRASCLIRCAPPPEREAEYETLMADSRVCADGSC
eukprot:3192463-Rhodomonas_salina.1